MIEILFQEIAACLSLLHHEMLPIFLVGGGELSKIQATWLEWCQLVTTLRVCKFCRHIRVMWRAVILEGIFTLHQDLGKWGEINLIHNINKGSVPFIFVTVLGLFMWQIYRTYCGDLEGHTHLIISYTAEISCWNRDSLKKFVLVSNNVFLYFYHLYIIRFLRWIKNNNFCTYI